MILIVDDKPENIFSLKTFLEVNKFEVDTASSGEEALKKVLKNKYALLLLDVQMPGMDGFEVAEAVSGFGKAKDIPIIFLSAVNIEKKYITKGYSSGGMDYVTKPMDPDLLLLKVKTFYKLSENTRLLNDADKELREENEEYKKTESESRRRVHELRSIIQAIPHIAFTIKTNGKIEFVNQLWYTYSAHEKVFPETHEDDPSIHLCWTIANMQGERFTSELLIKNVSTNKYVFHLLLMTPIKEDDVVVKWMCTLTDISAQKSALETLEHRVAERTTELQEINRQLEMSNQDLQQFASIASHDLKEPLRKIQTFSSMIKERYLTDKVQGEAYLDRIMYCSKRMSLLINNLLDYSTLSASKLFEVTDLNKIVAEVLIDLELVIEEKKAEFHIDKLHHLDALPGQIRQVFQNIITNALKFSRKDVPPVIHIHTDTVEGNALDSPVSESGPFCRITIHDNGIGFSEEYLDRIFAIFQRLNSRIKYEGTGIGLAIVKRIVENHHGVITATSKLNEGSSFIVVLPVKQQSHEPGSFS